jgi:class 3 adenylate cyclase
LAGGQGARGKVAEPVQRLGLAEPVAEVAEQRQGLPAAGGGGRVVPGQPLYQAEVDEDVNVNRAVAGAAAQHERCDHCVMRADLPSGTVTFLFTDIEGSTALLHKLGAERYAAALAEHRRALRRAFASHGGVEVDTQGDAFFYAFPVVPGAVLAAAEGQGALASGPIRVRMGMHTGTPYLTPEGYRCGCPSCRPDRFGRSWRSGCGFCRYRCAGRVR